MFKFKKLGILVASVLKGSEEEEDINEEDFYREIAERNITIVHEVEDERSNISKEVRENLPSFVRLKGIFFGAELDEKPEA